MMDRTHIQENFSVAAMHAIASDTGVIYQQTNTDYGIDGSFKDIAFRSIENGKSRFSENGYRIDVQLKATTSYRIDNDTIIYDLEVKNYNDLIKTDVGCPRILVLYLMPSDAKQWLCVNDQHIILERSAWWCSLRGQPQSDNTATKRIHIPVTQVLTSEALSFLIGKVRRGEDI